MSDDQIKKLFAGLHVVADEISAMRDELEKVKKIVNRASANSMLVVDGYRIYGGEIEQLKRSLEQLKIKCPLLKFETDEFEKVRDGDSNGKD